MPRLYTDQQRADTARRKRESIKRAQAYVYAILHEASCADCGEEDMVVFEFDHVRGDKVESVARMISQGAGVGKIQREIEKCEVVCANCHRRRTARRGGWARLVLWPNG